MAWAAVAAGAMNIAGSLTSSLMSADQAQVTRKFIRRMDNTKYERTMRDMRRAGLNPMLAYQQGAQSTAAGPTATVSDMGSVGSRAVEAGTSAREVASKKSLRGTQENVNAEQSGLLREQQGLVREQRWGAQVDRELKSYGVWSARERAHVDRSPMGKKAIRLGRAAELAAAPLSSAVGAVSPWRRGGQPR